MRASFPIVVASLIALPPAHAQTFPTKPIRIVVSTAPGSPPDTLARLLADPLSALGQPVIVENRPGGSGTIGAAAVAKATPDGHTLGIITLQHTVAPALVAKMPYDTLRDLAPVTELTWTANILVVRASSAIRSATEFVTAARSKPGHLTYASAGNGTPSHIASELFQQQAKIKVLHVPFKGIAQALTAVLGGEVDIAFAGVAAAAPHLKTGKLLELGTAAARRLPTFPELATLAEAGFPNFRLDEWNAVVAPAGTPADVIARLGAEFTRIVGSPDAKSRLAALGLYPADSTGPAKLDALLRSELPRWKKLVAETGIRTD